jgi:hypothetical protein
MPARVAALRLGRVVDIVVGFDEDAELYEMTSFVLVQITLFAAPVMPVAFVLSEHVILYNLTHAALLRFVKRPGKAGRCDEPKIRRRDQSRRK